MATQPFAPTIYKGAAPGANTNIFSNNLTPIRNGYSRIRIQIQLATTSVVNLIVMPPPPAQGAQDTLVCPLNGGVAITANELTLIEVVVSSDHQYNLQVATNGIISLLYIENVRS